MDILNILTQFLLYYPLVMSTIWLCGSFMYYLFIEHKNPAKQDFETDTGISFLISCYNEEATIEATIESIHGLSYPLKEIIVVNDGSSDNTAAKILSLQDRFDFKFIDLEKNQGKANALNNACEQALYEYVMCVDADTTIDDAAPYYMMENILGYENVGAVTGNPRIRNKRSLLAKIQIVEFASIIGCIKRTQQLNGFVNTVSGVFTLFSKEAVEKSGYWDIDMVTEDIALSWKLHFNHYKIIYEPRALCYMLVPESLRGLFKQRIRWAQGNQEVLLRDYNKVNKVKNLAFWLLFLEQILSVVWVLFMMTTIIITLLQVNLIDFYFYQDTLNILLVSAFLLITINIILFSFAMVLDSRYEKNNLAYIIYLSWYPLFYWFLNSLTIVLALPKSFKRKKGEFATWTSPDRGVSK